MEQTKIKFEQPTFIYNVPIRPGDVILMPDEMVKEYMYLGKQTEEPAFMKIENGELKPAEEIRPTPNTVYEALRPHVLSYLMSKDKGEKSQATELVVDIIEENETIRTIRDDDKPEMWIYKKGVYQPNAKTYIKEICKECLGRDLKTWFLNEVIFKIEARTYIKQNKFFENQDIKEIAVKNGLINTLTGELSEFTPEKKHFQKIPVEYTPGVECPNIIQFFKDILKNEEDLPLVQELFGYLLYKEYNIERAFMLTGTGRNGKGKFMDLIKRFIGAENCASVPLQHFENNIFAISEVHNKLANISGDLDKSALKHTGSFKQLTGRDLITGNRKFKTNIYFENYAKMVFAANELPITYDLTPAFFMRWVILEFPYTFVTEEEYEAEKDYKKAQWLKIRNPNIIKEITTPEELSGLLNWALEGLQRLQTKKDFSYSKSVDQTKTLWLRKSDSFNAFCLDKIEEEYGAYITKNQLRKEYSQYCKKHDLKPAGDKHIKEFLTRDYGVTESRSGEDKTIWKWEGIKFKDQEPVYANWV